MKYKNPWHKKLTNDCGPEFYETEEQAREYRGFLIFHRIKSNKRGANIFDIVHNGTCVAQRAGDTNHGLNLVIDKLIDQKQGD